VSRFESRNARS